MKKQLSDRLWINFLEVLKNPSTLKDFESYYKSIVTWINDNNRFFTNDLLKKHRLDVLMEIEPSKYIIDNPEFELDKEPNRFKKNRPTSIDTFLMIVGNRLWDIVTIRSGKDCPNCLYDELRYLLIESLSKEQEIILECESCAWIEHIGGTKLNEGIIKVIPANKNDLKKFGLLVIYNYW